MSDLTSQAPQCEFVLFQTEAEIEIMQGRRTALTSAAVIGKIDVRNWIAPEVTKNKDVT